MKLSVSLEQTDREGVLRLFVYNTVQGIPRDVTVVHDIAEGDWVALCYWLHDCYPNINTVKLSDGTFEDPDCLTVMEAAEAAMV
jgi:hypothetical protein